MRVWASSTTASCKPFDTAEIVVDRCGIDPRPLADVAATRALEAHGRKHLSGRLEQQLSVWAVFLRVAVADSCHELALNTGRAE